MSALVTIKEGKVVAVHPTKAWGGEWRYIHPFLTLAQDGGDW
jgi:hypothetical protein